MTLPHESERGKSHSISLGPFSALWVADVPRHPHGRSCRATRTRQARALASKPPPSMPIANWRAGYSRSRVAGRPPKLDRWIALIAVHGGFPTFVGHLQGTDDPTQAV